ncbi:MAG: elongation factor 1-alpha C-terminal domain-related protein, partial [Solirubrobacteraceae bacterium]
LEQAFPPMSVSLRLDAEIDVSRGDIIVGAEDPPAVTRQFEAIVCWMADAPLRERGRYLLKHTTRTTKAQVVRLAHRIDVNSLRHDETATELGLNDIGRVHLRTGDQLAVDRYSRNRSTGSFILLDESTNDTIGAGMIVAAVKQTA